MVKLTEPRIATRVAAVVIAVVVIARILLALLTPAPILEADALGYDASARRLIEAGYFSHVVPGTEVGEPGPDANTLPGYAVFLAAVYLVSGVSAAQPAVSIAQALLSGVTLAGVFWLGRRLAGQRGALVALALGTVYVPFWWSYRYALTEDLFMALSVAAACVLVWSLDVTGSAMLRRAVAFGVVASSAVYVRAAAAPWLIVAFLTLLVARRAQWRQIALAGLVAALTVAACFAPWWVRNASIYGRFVPLSVRGAHGALIATFDDWGDLTEPGRYWSARHLSPAEQLAEDERLAELTRARNVQQLKTDPVGTIWRRVRATLISIATFHPNPYGGFSGLAGLVEALHLSIVGLALAGLWRARHRWEAWVYASYPLAMVITYGLILIFSRYVFPAMPFLIALAAAGATTSRKHKAAAAPSAEGRGA